MLYLDLLVLSRDGCPQPSITGKIHPVLIRKINIVIAADHGVTEEGVSAYPQEVTNLMIAVMLKGKAGINIISKSVNSDVVVIDAGTVTLRGTGIDDESLKNKISVIKRALNINKPDPNDAIDILQKVGGFEIGAMTGVILSATSKRIPVIIDGFISTSAAIIAQLLSPNCMDFVIASHKSVEPGHIMMLNKLNKEAYLDLNFRLGEGTGSAMMMPLVDSACGLLNDMITLEDAMKLS